MSHTGDSTTGFIRFDPELPALLDIAKARLRRQKRYARPLSKGGKRAAGMEALVERASACIAELARPKAVVVPVPTQAEKEGVCLAGQVVLDDPDLASGVSCGGKVSIYLLTLGYDSQHALDWLERDYVAHHVQSDLASEVLFALGRQVYDAQRAQLPAGARLKRISVQTDTLCGQRLVWDAPKVQALIEVFGNDNPGISVTDTGCFQPLHSIIGLTIAL